MEAFGVIYRITNIVNGKVYIGQSVFRNHKNRLSEHISAAKRAHCDSFNTKLSRAIRKYGKEAFVSEVICFCDSKISMNEAEISLIKAYNSRNDRFGYNISAGGDGTVGVIPSKETRLKLSVSHRGYKHSDETKAKMSVARMGRVFTPESRKKISDSNIGIKKPTLKGNKHAAGNKNYLNRIEKRGADHPCSIKIVQLNAGFGLIKEWDSVADATRDLNINNISRGINNIKKMPGGYRWMTKEKYNLEYGNINK
jgi:group I intron endonuclease